MNIEEKLPNLPRQLAEQPFGIRFRLSNVCNDEWGELTPGERSQLGRQFRRMVRNGEFADVISIGKPLYGHSPEEYIRLER